MIKAAAYVLLAVVIGYGLHAIAQARIEVRPALVPISSSSSNGVSFAWFYDASLNTVYVCRAGQGIGDTIECKAKSTLP